MGAILRIKKGDRGKEVVDIQRRLSVLGFDLGPISVDGAYETNTEAAVKQFQSRHTLPVTGVIDSVTWRALVDATYKLGDRALYLRYPFLHGNDVFQLQRWLGTLGFHDGEIDGIFGPSTERSVRDCQLNFALSPDGIVGSSTVAALLTLRKLLEKEASVPIMRTSSTSFVSSINDKKIAVGCDCLKKEDIWQLIEESDYLYADLAYRFSNLLELLGADIRIFNEPSEVTADNELVISFRKYDKDRDDVLLINNADNEKSIVTASYIASELNASLKGRLGRVETNLALHTYQDWPQIEIMVNRSTALDKKDKLEKDVFKQKVASAIFDGIKRYFSTLSTL